MRAVWQCRCTCCVALSTIPIKLGPASHPSSFFEDCPTADMRSPSLIAASPSLALQFTPTTRFPPPTCRGGTSQAFLGGASEYILQLLTRTSDNVSTSVTKRQEHADSHTDPIRPSCMQQSENLGTVREIVYEETFCAKFLARSASFLTMNRALREAAKLFLLLETY